MITNLKGMEKNSTSHLFTLPLCKTHVSLISFWLNHTSLTNPFPPPPPIRTLCRPSWRGGLSRKVTFPPCKKALMGELKRLTPALWTTHWPPLCGLPHGLLCWLPCKLPPRTSINNQPNLLLWGKRLKPTCSTMNPKQEYHKVNLVHLFVVLSSCWTLISMISISLDVRKVQKSYFLDTMTTRWLFTITGNTSRGNS